MEVCGAARGVTHLPQAVLQAWCVAAPHTPCGDRTHRSSQTISNGYGKMLQLACTLTVCRRLLITGRSASRAFMVSAMLKGRKGLRGMDSKETSRRGGEKVQEGTR